MDVDPSGEWGAHKLRHVSGRDRVYSVRPEAQRAALELAELVSHETGGLPAGGETLWLASLGVADDLVVVLPDDAVVISWLQPLCAVKRLAARGKTRPHNGGGP